MLHIGIIGAGFVGMNLYENIHNKYECVCTVRSHESLNKLKSKNIDAVMTLEKNDIFTIIGMELGVNRLRCAYITLEALQNIYQQYKSRSV